MTRKKRSRRKAAKLIPQPEPKLEPMPFRFFSLPIEIRNMVYAELVGSSVATANGNTPSTPTIPVELHPWLCASRACRTELKALWPRVMWSATLSILWDTLYLAFERIRVLSIEDKISRSRSGLDLALHTKVHSLQLLQALDGWSFKYFKVAQSGFELLRNLQELNTRFLKRVTPRFDGTVNMMDFGDPWDTYKIPREWATTMRDNWNSGSWISADLKDRIKDVSVKARRRSSIMQGYVVFDISLKLYTMEELDEKRLKEAAAATEDIANQGQKAGFTAVNDDGRTGIAALLSDHDVTGPSSAENPVPINDDA